MGVISKSYSTFLVLKELHLRAYKHLLAAVFEIIKSSPSCYLFIGRCAGLLLQLQTKLVLPPLVTIAGHLPKSHKSFKTHGFQGLETQEVHHIQQFFQESASFAAKSSWTYC